MFPFQFSISLTGQATKALVHFLYCFILAQITQTCLSVNTQCLRHLTVGQKD